MNIAGTIFFSLLLGGQTPLGADSTSTVPNAEPSEPAGGAMAAGSLAGGLMGGLFGLAAWPNQDNVILAIVGGASFGAIFVGGGSSGAAASTASYLLLPSSDAGVIE